MWVKQTDLIFPLICNSNWEFSGTETTHTQAKWGSRPLLQLCPLILMTLNDLNIRPHHNLAKWCLFSAMAGPIGSMGHGPMGRALYPGCDPGVMMMYSLNISVYASYSETEKEARLNVFRHDIVIYVWKLTLKFYLLAVRCDFRGRRERSELLSGDIHVYLIYCLVDSLL